MNVKNLYKPIWYKLDENKNVIECSANEWAEQLEIMIKNHTKHVADDYINNIRISTVWLGIDHGFSMNGLPLLFETMVFCSPREPYESYCERYPTWKEAEEGHKRAIEWVKNGCKDEEASNEI